MASECSPNWDRTSHLTTFAENSHIFILTGPNSIAGNFLRPKFVLLFALPILVLAGWLSVNWRLAALTWSSSCRRHFLSRILHVQERLWDIIHLLQDTDSQNIRDSGSPSFNFSNLPDPFYCDRYISAGPPTRVYLADYHCQFSWFQSLVLRLFSIFHR